MRNSLAAVAAIPALAVLALAHSPQPSQPRHLVLIPENEPGETLIVRGTVYAPDGVMPVAGLRLDIHQADAMGYYCMPPSPERDRTLPRDNCPDAPPGTARLRGSLTTDAQGRYEFHSIKPGSYPRTRNPAHIHFRAAGAGYPEQYPHDLNFAGDPFISAAETAAAKEAGKFNFICEPERDARGVLHCEYNILLERK